MLNISKSESVGRWLTQRHLHSEPVLLVVRFWYCSPKHRIIWTSDSPQSRTMIYYYKLCMDHATLRLHSSRKQQEGKPLSLRAPYQKTSSVLLISLQVRAACHLRLRDQSSWPSRYLLGSHPMLLSSCDTPPPSTQLKQLLGGLQALSGDNFSGTVMNPLGFTQNKWECTSPSPCEKKGLQRCF